MVRVRQRKSERANEEDNRQQKNCTNTNALNGNFNMDRCTLCVCNCFKILESRVFSSVLAHTHTSSSGLKHFFACCYFFLFSFILFTKTSLFCYGFAVCWLAFYFCVFVCRCYCFFPLFSFIFFNAQR